MPQPGTATGCAGHVFTAVDTCVTATGRATPPGSPPRPDTLRSSATNVCCRRTQVCLGGSERGDVGRVVMVVGIADATPCAHGGAGSGPDAPGLHAARAVLRPDVRGGGVAGGGGAPPRPRRRRRRRGPGRLPAGVLRPLVGVDAVHLVRLCL